MLVGGASPAICEMTGHFWPGLKGITGDGIQPHLPGHRVGDSFLEPTIDAIVEAARTGVVGDGKIWVRNIESVVRVRTGERDEVALN